MEPFSEKEIQNNFKEYETADLNWHTLSMDQKALAKFAYKAKVSKEEFSFSEMQRIKDRRFTQFTHHAGLSLELLLKACAIRKFGKLRGNKHHDLKKLAEAVNLDLSEIQKQFLKQLTHKVRWVTRYPMPVNMREYREYVELAEAMGVRMSKKVFWPKSDEHRFTYERFVELWNLANIRFEQLPMTNNGKII